MIYFGGNTGDPVLDALALQLRQARPDLNLMSGLVNDYDRVPTRAVSSYEVRSCNRRLGWFRLGDGVVCLFLQGQRHDCELADPAGLERALQLLTCL